MSGERVLHRRGFIYPWPCCGEHGSACRLRRSLGPALGQTRARFGRDADARLGRGCCSRPRHSPANIRKPTSHLRFRANGSTDPGDPDYKAHAANGFADWKLGIAASSSSRWNYRL